MLDQTQPTPDSKTKGFIINDKRNSCLRDSLIIFLSLGLSQAAPICTAQSLTGTATKIEVVNESATPTAGAEAQVRIKLVDPKNNPAKADKDFVVKIEGLPKSGGAETANVLIKAGEDSKTVQLPLKEAGALKLNASNRELVSGGTILNVREASGQQPVPSPTVVPENSPSPIPNAPSPSPRPKIELSDSTNMSQREHTENLSDTPRLIPPETGALARSASEEAPLIRAQRPRAFRISFNAATSQVASTVAQPDRPWTPAITFMSYPDRKFAANKKDVATIYAMLAPNDIAPWDIAFSLMSSIGPQTILIRKGEDHGETQLGTDQPGTVNIKFLSSNPWPPEISGVPMKINFAPPVAGLSIRANPPRIGLFESTEIAVQLVNEDAIGTATDENRRVWLAVDSGTGEFDSTELKIEANNYRVTTKFRPIWPGSIRLIAGSPGFRDVHTDLTIAGPTLTLILCGIGGLAGGFLAFSSQNARWPRIVIGLFTGVVLYWLLAFGLVHIPNFPHAAVFSPYSAAIIALLGGWGGTNTITFALKQVGFNW